MFAHHTTLDGAPFRPDISYQNELDAYEVNVLQAAWPQVVNPFFDRLAMSIRQGSTGEIASELFGDLVACVAHRLAENCVARLRLTFIVSGDELRVRYLVAANATNAPLPIEADDPGFFTFAMRWFARARPEVELCITPDFFWFEAA